jgi:hypothetical protein
MAARVEHPRPESALSSTSGQPANYVNVNWFTFGH